MAIAWRNRIVGTGEELAGQLVANPGNFRIHPKNQQAALAGSLDTLGWVDTVLVNRNTGYVIDGHARVTEALRRGENTPVPVLYVDLTPEEEAQALLSLDPIAALAATDRNQMAALMQQVQSDDARVQEFMAELAEKEKIDFGKPIEDVEPQIDKAEELRIKWGVELGQLWQLGEHRLICGDCTDKAVVDRLMDGEMAELVVTSPPYAVGKEYEVGVSFSNHLIMLENMADRCIEIVVPGGFIFTNFGEIAALSHASPMTGSARQCIYPISRDYWRIFHEERKCDLYAQRIWYKPFNRLQQPFWSYHTSIPHHQEWEHIWTWRTPGGNNDAVYDWDISVHAVWDTRNESTDDKPLTRHSAAFPVGIPERAIKAHSAQGNTIYEPFSGSGTTIIACERLNRKCRAIEISPGYCAVAIERWAMATGKTPEIMHNCTA